jgi:AcrR family transcriptional regulator
MAKKDTEQVILDAARKVFVELGPANARMQDVAEEADITPSLLHYYFRKRDQLFAAVFEEELSRFIRQQIQLIKSEQALLPKLKEFAHKVIDFHAENPHLAAFVAFETHYNTDRLDDMEDIYRTFDLTTLQNQIDEAAETGDVQPMDAEHLLVNVLSLCLLPFVAMPIFRKGFGMDEDEYAAFIEERKEEVPRFVERALTCGSSSGKDVEES